MDRKAFITDLAELLVQHQVKNCLVVYTYNGEVCNTTLNSEDNEAAKVLNHMSDVINGYFETMPEKKG